MKASHFSAVRFGRLLRAHWAENRRDYAWFVGLTAIVDCVLIAFVLGTESRSSLRAFQFDQQISWYASGLFACALIFAGRHFKHLASPGSALVALMRPASTFEKWLLAFLCVGVLFPLAFTLCYCLLNYPVVQLAKALYTPVTCASCPVQEANFGFYVPLITQQVQQATSGDALAFARLEVFSLLLLWSLQALVIGGTVFFKRSPVLRTVLFCFLLGIGLMWLGTSPQMGVFWSPSVEDVVQRDTIEYVLSVAQWTGLPLLLWVAVFFHLKECEVS